MHNRTIVCTSHLCMQLANNLKFCDFWSDDSIGQTPLCKAAYHGNEAIVDFLLQRGAHVDGKFPDPKDKRFDWKVCN